MSVKIRPTLLILAIGLVVAVNIAVVMEQWEAVATLAVALAGTLSKMAESEEKTDGGAS